MGASKSKLSCYHSTDVNDPSIIVHTLPTANYSLEFCASLMQCKGKRKVLMKHVESAREALENNSFWKEWLEYTMRDSVHTDIENSLGVCMKSKNIPPVLNIIVELDPIYKKSRRDPEGHNQITGVISWRSIPTDEKALEDAIGWRLGDWLCQYGIQDENQGWICFFFPGTLTVH